MFIYRLARALDDHRVSYAIVGGYAVALQGAVRGTVDVDIAIRISKKDFLAVEEALKSMQLESRLPIDAAEVFEFREEYIRKRNLIAWSFFNPKKPIEVVDVLLTQDVSRMKVDRIPSGAVTLNVASIDDLIRMKSEAGRPQDLADIEALKNLKKGSRR